MERRRFVNQLFGSGRTIAGNVVHRGMGVAVGVNLRFDLLAHYKDENQTTASASSQLFFLKLQGTVLGIDVDSLAFADLTFQNADAERIENLLLNRAP